MTLTRTAPAWPGLEPVPAGPRAALAAAIARRLFVAGTRRLGITWSDDGVPADITLHRPEEFFARVGSHGLIGFGESYLTGAWDADDLGGTLTVLCREVAHLVPRWMQRLRPTYVIRPPRHQRSSTANSRGNIAHHYDLSNELFATFLDPTLTYSAALFEGTEDLEQAQVRKIERILDAAVVGPGTRLLEIGTGWGELAIRAARRGADVRSITLSSEQRSLALERIAAAGLADRITVDLLDYRALDGSYDAVVSVEMIEAVGHEYWPAYFRTLDRVLAPGGRVALQAITMPHRRMLATRNTYTWINKYIFPGGFLPSTEAIEQTARRHTTLRLGERFSFGPHYAETLRRWDQRFAAAREHVLDLGFDETFLRMWHFYLEYARAGFASGYLDVQQLVLTREER
ncbi:MAG: class I SAM-dependent methyltransferase [Nocardioidaceae bacterium]|nr:class I SAM-dependent methyltransferase [Nocardioidaceae bacterium]